MKRRQPTAWLLARYALPRIGAMVAALYIATLLAYAPGPLPV